MELQKKNYLQRDSGIELLKVIAIFLIIINHLTQTWLIYSKTELIISSMDAEQFMFLFFRHFGSIGNLVFFTCSAWFLLDKQHSKKEKIIQMLMDIWVISMLYLAIPLATKADFVSRSLIIQSLFPTTFENNWYLTAYLLFYMIVPFLNKILTNLNRKAHLRAVLVLVVLYLVINNITVKEAFFCSKMTVWITIYFIIAYMKRYQGKYADNTKRNALVLALSIPALVAFILFIYFVCLKLSLSDKWLMHWNRSNNPIIIVMAIAALNVAKNASFKNALINYISSLSLLIYIIHENLIFRTYYRKYMFEILFRYVEKTHIWAWILLLAVVLFFASFIAATIYKFTLQKLIAKLSTWLLTVFKNIYLKIENKIVAESINQPNNAKREKKEPVGSGAPKR